MCATRDMCGDGEMTQSYPIRTKRSRWHWWHAASMKILSDARQSISSNLTEELAQYGPVSQFPERQPVQQNTVGQYADVNILNSAISPRRVYFFVLTLRQFCYSVLSLVSSVTRCGRHCIEHSQLLSPPPPPPPRIMNCKEHHLPELELATGQVREALQCILHTILL